MEKELSDFYQCKHYLGLGSPISVGLGGIITSDQIGSLYES